MESACILKDPCITIACPFVKDDDGMVCGQPKTYGVEIINEFNRAYEKRLEYIDKETEVDCAELKYPIYKDWVQDLIAQNRTFLQILDELEREASHRFELLETKLKSDTKAFGSENRFKKLENDLKNLLELIHRALQTNKWNAYGLDFETITVENIFGNCLKFKDADVIPKITCELASESEAEPCIRPLETEMGRLASDLKRKDCILEDYKGQINHLQLDFNTSCDKIDAKSELEDKFKLYIEELKDIIKDKDEMNSLLLKENETLKETLSKNAVTNLEPEKQKLQCKTKETEPSEAQLKTYCLNSKDLDLVIVENCRRAQSDINICNRLNQEINELLTQIRSRESHICNQNSIICNFQEKLNETRVKLKLITCERDQVCNKLSIIESELEKIKDDIILCPASPASPCCVDTTSGSHDEDTSKKVQSDKKSIILHLKPMVNSMRETIVTLNRENCSLKTNLEEFKDCLSESKCETANLKKQLSALNNKSCADKEVLVKFKCDHKDYSSTDTNAYRDVEGNCDFIEKSSKRRETHIQKFNSVFKKVLNQFGVDVAECDLDVLADDDKKCVDKLVACIKETLNERNSPSESNTSICQLKAVLNTKESEIFDLKCKLTALNTETENLGQAMQLNEDKVNILSEERDRLDLDCKNQLTIIENLREALEMVKRGHNIALPFYHEDLLCEQLSSYFVDNMKMERQMDLIRDENLELKRQLYDLESDYASGELRLQTDNVIPNRREKSIYKLLKKDLDQIKKQSTTIQSSLCNRESELKKLKYFRDRCLEMEINCRSELDVQKSHYTEIINELHEELASLSDQLAEQQKESLQQNDLINDTSALENSISEIENQNDILQKTLCSYDSRLVATEDKCKQLKAERNRLKCELDCFKTEVDKKDTNIFDLKLEIEKLKSQLTTHDKYPIENNNQTVCNRPTSSTGYAVDVIKRLNCELQNIKKSALEDKNCLSREIEEYCTQIGKLKNKICYLENLVAKREKEVEFLTEKNCKIDKRTTQIEDDLLANCSRVSQLERDKFKLREIVNSLSLQLSETKKESNCTEKHLISELNCYKEKVDEQIKVIKCLKQQYEKSNDEIDNMKSLGESLNKENTRLKKEICEAKDRLAAFEGHDGKMTKLLNQAQQDLQREQHEINRLKQIEYEFSKLREQNCKIYQQNCDMTKKLKNGECDYEKLAVEYKKLLDVKEQALAALKTARAWQKENCEREKLIKLNLQKNTEHIQMLAKDRKQLISKMNQMHRDEIILRSEIDILKEKLAHCRCSRRYAFTDTENSGSTALNRVDRYSSDPEVINDDQDDHCLKSVKQTTKKIYRTRKFWQNGIKNACE